MKVKNFRNDHQYLNELKKFSESINENMGQFQAKEMREYENLQMNYERIDKELEIFNSQLDSYDKVEPKTTQIKQLKQQTIEEDDEELDDLDRLDQQDIKELNETLKRLKHKIDVLEKKIVQNNGINCGWNSKDHGLFLKLVNKNQETEFSQEFINDLIVFLPQISVQEIEHHIDKYRTFKTLEKEKKLYIQSYKDTKAQIQKKNIELIHKEDELHAKIKQERTKEQQNKKQNQVKVKQQLKEWKAKKQSIRELQDEKEFQVKQEQKNLQKQQLEYKRLKQKEEVAFYKEMKEVNKMRKQEYQEYEQKTKKRQVSVQQMERIKQKEQDQLRKKQELINQRQQKVNNFQNKQENYLNRANDKYIHIQSRLDQETKAQIYGKSEKYSGGGKDALSFGGDVLGNNRRMIPNWRHK